MKKISIILLLMLALSCTLFSCQKKPEPTPPAHVHSFGDWVVTKQPTCAEDGLLSRSCTGCTYKEENKIAPTGIHRQVEDAAVAATCTAEGLTSGVHCGDCGLIIIEQKKISIIEHTYSSENDGTCNKCGFIRDVVCAHETLIKLSAKEPGCIETGLTEGIRCHNCGDIIVEQQEIPALGHSEVVENSVSPTCTQPGYTVGKTCSVCHSVLVQKTEIAPTGHRSTEWIVETEPTEKTEGLKYKICTVCTERFDDTTIPFVGANGIAYEPNDIGNTCTVVGIGTYSGEELYLPDYIAGYRVTAIANEAFRGCTKLKKLVIPETVKTIGDYAFAECTGLTDFTIPSSVTYIGTYIFDGCEGITTIYYNSVYPYVSSYYYINTQISAPNLKKVVFNGEYIPNSIMAGSSVEEIVIGENVTSIGGGAFERSSIKKITIPNNVTSLGDAVFYQCTYLEEVSLPVGITQIGASMFYQCSNLKSIDIPYGVTLIGENAFLNSGIESIDLPNSITSIGSYAFSTCSNLQSVDLPDSLTVISSYMFYYSKALKSIVIPDSVTTIESRAFQYCSSLVNVTIGSGVTSIGDEAFYGCIILTGIVIPRSVVSIMGYAFEGCISLTDIYYTGSVNEWAKITIGSNNTILAEVNMHYNYVVKK